MFIDGPLKLSQIIKRLPFQEKPFSTSNEMLKITDQYLCVQTLMKLLLDLP